MRTSIDILTCGFFGNLARKEKEEKESLAVLFQLPTTTTSTDCFLSSHHYSVCSTSTITLLLSLSSSVIFLNFAADSESEPGIGICGWLLTMISWGIVMVTLPFSLFVCFKVRSNHLSSQNTDPVCTVVGNHPKVSSFSPLKSQQPLAKIIIFSVIKVVLLWKPLVIRFCP